MNIEKAREVILHVINNNKYLEEGKKKKTTLCIEGPSGIGKTSIVEQIAAEFDMNFVKKNLAEMEETSELVGFPIREFEKENGDWVDEKHLDMSEEKIKLTGRKRTSYCKPDWVPQDADERGGILLLDDFSRADARLIQATMELVDRSSYGSWSLPSGWTVLLSTNPDNGDYFVTSMDSAQKTRYIKVDVSMSVDVWAKWAEQAGIDSRCINFLLLNPEMLKPEGEQNINPRLATDFFNAISSIQDFRINYDLISLLGQGSVGSEFTQTFISFIEGNLDKIPSPDKILEAETPEESVRLIKAACGSKDTSGYKQHIASLITNRLINNVGKRIKDSKKLDEDLVDRTIDIMKEEVFSGDINNYLFKTLNAVTENDKYTSDIDLITKVNL